MTTTESKFKNLRAGSTSSHYPALNQEMGRNHNNLDKTKTLGINGKMETNMSEIISSPVGVTQYADFVDKSGDIDTFLTQISSMPQLSQNKLLQEKLLIVNEKLCNVFEEMQLVSKFHSKVDDFLSDLRERMCEKPIN